MTDREKFEAWRSRARPVLSWTFVGSMNASGYRAAATQADWEAWQASRKQALEEAVEAAVKELDRCGTHLYPDDKVYVQDAIRALANPEWKPS